MRLQVQGIDDYDDGVGRVRRSRGLIGNDGGVNRGKGIYVAYKGLEKTTAAASDGRQS